MIDLLESLKPELIAPVVAWLCHEDCIENGAIIEAAGGWAGKCKITQLI
jgi:3-hydroxyacyl-CoA dehydrogenase/3a,7a,12a-trihydroxy-5b-cholest-24-enoyl-CoA hydratase